MERAVVSDGLGQQLILGLGKSDTDSFTLLFGGPEIIRPPLDAAPGNAAQQRAADQGALRIQEVWPSCWRRS